MCGTATTSNLEWTVEPPTEEGDYLWLEVFECGCVHRSGIADVFNWDDYNFKPNYILPGGVLGVAWGAQPPYFFEGEPVIDFWAKVDLPGPRRTRLIPELTPA
jgi:hypothetical protein